MKRHALSMLALLVPVVARAHDQVVHYQLSWDALATSGRFQDALDEYGLRNPSYDILPLLAAQWAAPSIGIVPQNAMGLVLAGSVLEDGVGARPGHPCGALILPFVCPANTLPSFGEFRIDRCLNHFQDQQGNGLHVNFPFFEDGQPAGVWAFDAPQNGFTWTQAIAAFHEAIVASEPQERRLEAERALIALGCNLHLLEDQFSPAHTRNDPHPGSYVPIGNDISLLEERGPLFVSSGNDPFFDPGLAPYAYRTHGEYFSNAVDWTSSRFFSDDTIEPDGIPVLEDADGTCSLWADLHETYLHAQSVYPVNSALAHRTTWDPGSSPPTTVEDLYGSACDQPWTFDTIVHDNLARLVPEAIAYSAGLIDHFFRAKLALTQEPDGSLTVANHSSLPGANWPLDLSTASGVAQMVFVTEDSDGRRTVLLDTPLPPSGIVEGASLSVPGFDQLVRDAGLVGETPIYLSVHGAAVGGEPAVAGGTIRWRDCGAYCVPDDGRFVGAFPAQGVGDLDRDGYDDYCIVGADETQFPWTWIVRCISGQTCAELWSTAPLPSLGQSILPAGDVNGDDVPDVVVAGSPASIRSGVDGTVILYLETSASVLMPLGDVVEGDGIWDVASPTNGGLVEVLSGASGNVVHVVAPPVWGRVVSSVGSGSAGSPHELFVESDPPTGRIAVISSADGAVLYDSSWVSTNEFTGHRDFLALPDVDGDDLWDFVAVKEPDRNLVVFSGVDGRALWQEAEGPSGLFAPAGDFDGDGRADIMTVAGDVGEWPDLSYRLRVYDAEWGHLLAEEFFPLLSSAFFGPGRLGDVNADGKDDLSYARFLSESVCLVPILGR